MPTEIILYDVRIAWDEAQQAGTKPPPQSVELVGRQGNTYAVKPDTDLPDLFSRVGTSHSRGTVGLLTIYAHGYAQKDAKGELHGGYGLQFGRQDILEENAARLFGNFRGLFREKIGIWLVGCEVAVRSAVKVGTAVTVGDGIALMRIIANAAGTGVKATRQKQSFEVVPGIGVRGVATAAGGRERQEFATATVDPGMIEGQVHTVMPDGARR